MTATERVELVFDTYAWVELLSEGRHAERVQELHVTRNVGTPTVVLAELAALYEARMPEMREAALEAVTSTTADLPLAPHVAVAAGCTRARLARERKGIGFVDCLILETARSLDARLVTGDPHLRGLDGVEFLD
jgi:predicted nucleic acid-binding protein